MLRAARFLIVVAALVVALPAAAVAQEEGDPGRGGGVPMLGPSRLTPAQIAGWFHATGHRLRVTDGPGGPPVTVEELAQLYIEEGSAEGVRGDLAFAQAVLETGFFYFPDYGQVRVGDNNFAGMGACDSCDRGRSFPSPRNGVRAQIQYLRNLADPDSRAANLAYPPEPTWWGEDVAVAVRNFDRAHFKGRAPTWNHMGNGNYATDPNYAVKVVRIYEQMLAFNGLPSECAGDGGSFCPEVVLTSSGVVAPKGPVRTVTNRVQGGKYELSPDGTVRALDGAPQFGSPHFDGDLARDLAVMPDGQGYIVLDAYGTLYKFGSATTGTVGALPGLSLAGDEARSIGIAPDALGYAVLDAGGDVHSFGSAPRGDGEWPGWRQFFSAGALGSDEINGTFHIVDTAGLPYGWLVSAPYDADFSLDDDGVDDGSSASIARSRTGAAGVPAFYAQPTGPALSPDRSLKASAYVKGENTTGRTSIVLAFFDAAHQHVGEVESTPLARGDTDWTRLAAGGAPPQAATSYAIYLVSANNKGRVWFDNVELSWRPTGS